MANGANVSIKCVKLTIFQRWGTSTVECILKKYLLTFHISYFGQINPSPIHPVAVQTKFEDLLQQRVKKDKGLSNWMPIKKKKRHYFGQWLWRQVFGLKHKQKPLHSLSHNTVRPHINYSTQTQVSTLRLWILRKAAAQVHEKCCQTKLQAQAKAYCTWQGAFRFCSAKRRENWNLLGKALSIHEHWSYSVHVFVFKKQAVKRKWFLFYIVRIC